MGIHDKHRSRLRERFIAEGSDHFADHEVLELLLCYAIPQKDVNGLAHELLTRYQSFHRVFEADLSDLMDNKGIGEYSAVFLKLIPEVMRRYHLSQRVNPVNFLKTPEEVVAYLRPHFFGRTKEVVLVLFVGPNGENLYEDILFEGTFDRVHIYTRDILAASLRVNSTHLIIAHNHPYGLAAPSPDDFSVTERLYKALSTIDITLVDHYIFSPTDYVSLRKTGYLTRIIRSCDL